MAEPRPAAPPGVEAPAAAPSRADAGSGSAEFLSDLAPAGLLHVATVRSPVARGAVRKISAGRLPPGCRLILPSDIPGKNRISSFGGDIPVLADERLSWLGEPVALVCGPDPAIVDAVARGVTVECEEEEALLEWRSFSSEQVAAKRVVQSGDPELAFAVAHRIVEDRWETGTLEHWYSEPQGALALFDYDKLAIRVASQWPFHARDSVALVLGCRPDEVSVRPTALGVHLDGRLWYPSLLACHAALAAWTCRAPARVLLTREEDFLYTTKRARSSVSLRAAIGPGAELTALDLRIAVDIGAYAPLAEEIISRACLAARGAYACPNLRVEGYAVRTSNPPRGSYAGIGSAGASFAMECAASRLAAAAELDPLEWRAANMLRKGSPLPSGVAMRDGVPFDAIAETIAAASDFRRKHAGYELIGKRRSGRADGPLRGIGFAFGWQGSGAFATGDAPGPFAVEAELGLDQELCIRTSAALEYGVAEIWRRTAAETLGLPLAAVRVAAADTDSCPNSGPLTLSRGVTIVNRLVESACRSIQKRRFREPLPLVGRGTWRPPRPLRWTAEGVDGDPYEGASWGGAVVELELDAWSLEPVVTGIWLCVDGGAIVSLPRATSTLRGAAIAALGGCLRERVDSDGAATLRESYFEYALLGPAETPPIRIDFIDPGRKGASRGIGDLPHELIPAAFATALGQASGIAWSSLPIRSEDCALATEDT